MLTRIHDMPAGTLGFEAVGEVDDDDIEDVLLPVLRQWTSERRKIRLLYLLGPRLEELEGDAWSAQASFVAGHPTGFERVAVVGDERWLSPVVATLSFLLPGQAKTFPVSELQAAKLWLGADLPAEAAVRP